MTEDRSPQEMMDEGNVLSDEQLQKLVVAAAVDGPVSETDLKQIIEWAEQTVLAHSLFRLVQDGRIKVIIRNGEIKFKV